MLAQRVVQQRVGAVPEVAQGGRQRPGGRVASGRGRAGQQLCGVQRVGGFPMARRACRAAGDGGLAERRAAVFSLGDGDGEAFVADVRIADVYDFVTQFRTVPRQGRGLA